MEIYYLIICGQLDFRVELQSKFLYFAIPQKRFLETRG